MNSTPEYALELKIKNNWLLKAMREKGIRTAAELARAAGCSQGDAGKMLRLSEGAYNSRGMIRPYIRRICNFLGVEVDDVVPPEHMENPLECNVFEVEASRQQLMIASNARPLEDTVDFMRLPSAIGGVLDELGPRLGRVLELRFGLNGEDSHTLAEVGSLIGVTAARVRQLEEKALRSLRHPDRSGAALRGFVDV